MQGLLIDWKFFLETNGPVLGLALVVSGLALLLGGWRLERFTLFVVYALTGIVASRLLGGDALGIATGSLLGGGGAVIVGMILRKHAAPALAGLFGLVAVWAMFQNSFVPPSVIYIMMVLTFFAVAAPAASHLDGTTIMLSSLTGAVLLVSGIVAMVVNSHFLAPHFRAMSAYAVFYPFLLLVAAVTGTFLQLSAVERKDCGETDL